MDLLLELLTHIVGDDTDPIDLLPLVVLAFMMVGIKHLRTLVLQAISDIGALRERIDVVGEVKGIAEDVKRIADRKGE